MLKWFCKNNHQQRSIAMDQNHFNTDEDVRKSGSHLTLAERGMIQALHKKGMSLAGSLRVLAVPIRPSTMNWSAAHRLARAIAAASPDILPNVDRKPTRRIASAPNAPARLIVMIANHSSSGCASASARTAGRLMDASVLRGWWGHSPREPSLAPRHSTICCGLTNCRSRSSICLMP